VARVVGDSGAHDVPGYSRPSGKRVWRLTPQPDPKLHSAAVKLQLGSTREWVLGMSCAFASALILRGA
jgi:hypothetical protein